MCISEKLTPEAMLGAPRRSPAVPNHDGTLALYTVSTYDFEEGKKIKELKVTNIQTGDSRVLSSDDEIVEALWLPGRSDIICLVKGDEGVTRLVVTGASQSVEEGKPVAEFDGELIGMKLKRLADGAFAFAAVGLVGDNGKLFNEKKQKKKSTARIFDTARVWVWDTMVKEKRYVIWYSRLSSRADGTWSLESELHNLLHGTELEVCGVYDVDEPQEHYDIGAKGILFNASCLKPDDEFTRWSCSDVYYTELPSFVEAPAQRPKIVTLEREQPVGRYQHLQISPDGEMMAFLFMPYRDDADTRVYLGHLSSLDVSDIFAQLGGRGPRLPPSGVAFAGSSDSLILTADDCGRTTLQSFKIPSSSDRLEDPVTIFRNGSVAAFYPLVEGNWNKLLVSSTSFVDSSLWQIIDTKQTDEPKVVSSLTRHGARFGLTHSMVSEIWYEGADETCVHAFIVKPSNFDPKKKYPWVLMPHGGPVGAWNDSWSTRWNAALWAEQGYVIVMPNIAGSVGYGLDFTSRVYGSWGGAPYEDLVNLMHYLEELPYLDMDRAALASASYGGYLISWIFGHDLATKFRCAIWHDGVTCLPYLLLGSDDWETPPHFDGPPLPWLPPASNQLIKWDPARPELLAKWHRAPPTLVIHGQRDYRCPVLEGLAAYRVLKAHGVEARFLTFEDEGHWVLGHENARVWNREVFSFLKKHIGGGQE